MPRGAAAVYFSGRLLFYYIGKFKNDLFEDFRQAYPFSFIESGNTNRWKGGLSMKKTLLWTALIIFVGAVVLSIKSKKQDYMQDWDMEN